MQLLEDFGVQAAHPVSVGVSAEKVSYPIFEPSFITNVRAVIVAITRYVHRAGQLVAWGQTMYCLLNRFTN